MSYYDLPTTTSSKHAALMDASFAWHLATRGHLMATHPGIKCSSGLLKSINKKSDRKGGPVMSITGS